MLVRRVDVDAAKLGDPDAAVWRGARGEVVSLVQAPAAMQPTRYIAAKWQDKPYGQVKTLAVKALRNADEIAFRLEWQDKTKNERRIENTDFPDAVAMLFPLSEQSPLIMGGEGAPVSLWYWRADHPTRARNDVANGIGTSRVLDAESISAQAKHEEGRWSVVLRRSLQLAKPLDGAMQFTAGQAFRTTFAVWDGGNLERAGIKAFSPSWLELTLDA
jgi:DMSO reductase family type II enzyme heme b subunit